MPVPSPTVATAPSTVPWAPSSNTHVVDRECVVDAWLGLPRRVRERDDVASDQAPPLGMSEGSPQDGSGEPLGSW